MRMREEFGGWIGLVVLVMDAALVEIKLLWQPPQIWVLPAPALPLAQKLWSCLRAWLVWVLEWLVVVLVVWQCKPGINGPSLFVTPWRG